jgi:hypothetical protein
MFKLLILNAYRLIFDIKILLSQPHYKGNAE